MRTVDVVAAVLLVVGGLNWGLVGIAHFDLVAAIFGMHFGETSMLTAWSVWPRCTRRFRSRQSNAVGDTIR
jgi:hypothetical protein